MIISRTPYRISLFGGGSDFAEFYKQHGGRVLSFAIDKYCYISLRELPPFFAHRDRVVYSKVENVSDYSDIQHPAVRAALNFLKPSFGVSITHDGDVPARSGIGSSSAFTVGLLNSILTSMKQKVNKRLLAEMAIRLEQDIIGENVGEQDQICSAYGGINRIEFYKDQPFRVIPLDLAQERQKELLAHCLLFYTGVPRISSDVAAEQKSRIPQNVLLLKELADIALKAERLLRSDSDIMEIGAMLHDAWQIKKQLSSQITTDRLDKIYETALKNGAVGGKVLGAGAGGFMLFFAAPEQHEKLRQALSGHLHVPFQFDMNGSQVIFNDHGDNL